ncbi:NADase-type glycan-binding domain-containing protein [Streptomyces poriferorum]|uniref:Zinc-ribbon domain-containing protein n=2 Tax=Streptomyces poriferorum TaxID=2798799 RepID=A0ABY9IQP5_9ACTN|nr:MULTISPECIES: zinc-ribbon domain-containing protein [unclassified Streptomyces]MDP5313899.1 zinc-ribbon domain-containing protein [Streptomyces sp. Alt4]WLQ57154.1 zinc-ribbon domain-containing protein [Streptomyces sp. Alt2]
MTRSCPACGAANEEDEDFCGSCGTYLGGSSSRRARTAEPVPEADAPAPEPDVTPPAPRPAPTPAVAPPPPVPVVPPAPVAEEPPPSAPEVTPEPAPVPVRPAPPAPAPVRPGRPVEPVADEPVMAVQPGVPIAQRPVVRPVVANEEPDGTPCPSCGASNRPGRKFCRRCATPLNPGEREEPLPWWRTRWPFDRKVRAGSGRLLRGSLIALVIAGLLVAGFLLVPAGRYVVEDVRDKLGGTGEISPSDVSASAAAPGHSAKLAVDGVTNTYWGAPKAGASLTAEFDKPFRLVGVTVHTGVSTKAEAFRQGARPTQADLRIRTKDGKIHEKAWTLTDKPGEQTVRTGISDVVSIEFIVREAAGQESGRPIALGEIEYFKRT